MEGKDRTAITVALITGVFGCLATIIAASIGLLPTLLDRFEAKPTSAPIVIVLTPATNSSPVAASTAVPMVAPTNTIAVAPSQVSQAPSATTAPTTAAALVPTRAALPDTPPPTSPPLQPTSTRSTPGATLTLPAAPTISLGNQYLDVENCKGGSPPTSGLAITFVLANNFERDQDFYIDGCLAAQIDSGKYTTFRILPHKTRELKNCLRGANPNSANDCNIATRLVSQDPYDWVISGRAPANGQITLLVLNQSESPKDIFLDTLSFPKLTIVQNSVRVIPLENQRHTVRACQRGATPLMEAEQCLERIELEPSNPILFYVIPP